MAHPSPHEVIEWYVIVGALVSMLASASYRRENRDVEWTGWHNLAAVALVVAWVPIMLCNVIYHVAQSTRTRSGENVDSNDT